MRKRIRLYVDFVFGGCAKLNPVPRLSRFSSACLFCERYIFLLHDVTGFVKSAGDFFFN